MDVAGVLDTTSPALAAFACSLRPDGMPEEVREAAKLQLVDTLGCGLAAAGLGVGAEARTVVAAGGGAARATVLGLASRVPAAKAALANGSLCHAFPGGVRIVDDGRVLAAELPFQPGAPENPLPAEAVEQTFLENSRLALPDEEADELLAALRRTGASLRHTRSRSRAVRPVRRRELARSRARPLTGTDRAARAPTEAWTRRGRTGRAGGP